jgi:hypothetical protein
MSLNDMRIWSRTKIELIGWFRRILERHGDDLRLIIWDDSGFDIAWELFWIKPDMTAGKQGGWLGTLATVTRWTTILDEDGQKPYVTRECSGDVLGYIAHEMAADRELIAGMSRPLAGSLRKLLQELDNPGPPVALVYVASHGQFNRGAYGYKIDDVSLEEIDPEGFSRIEEWGGLIFVNSCHSGHLTVNSGYNDGMVRGFAEVFLRSGATAFIGTGGFITSDGANKVAAKFLAQLQDKPDRPAAVALRDYRKDVAVPEVMDWLPLSNRSAEGVLVPFLSASMYLFFGAPGTTVALPGMTQ